MRGQLFGIGGRHWRGCLFCFSFHGNPGLWINPGAIHPDVAKISELPSRPDLERPICSYWDGSRLEALSVGLCRFRPFDIITIDGLRGHVESLWSLVHYPRIPRPNNFLLDWAVFATADSITCAALVQRQRPHLTWVSFSLLVEKTMFLKLHLATSYLTCQWRQGPYTVPFQSICQSLWCVTCLTKIWFRQVAETSMTSTNFRQAVVFFFSKLVGSHLVAIFILILIFCYLKKILSLRQNDRDHHDISSIFEGPWLTNWIKWYSTVPFWSIRQPLWHVMHLKKIWFHQVAEMSMTSTKFYQAVNFFFLKISR